MSRPSRSGRWVVVFLTIGVGAGLRPVAAQEKAPDKAEVTIKRRTTTTEDGLRKLLQDVPEAGFDQKSAGELAIPLAKSINAQPPVKRLPADLGMTTLHENAARDKQSHATFLPWIVGADNELVKEEAEHLHMLSLRLRDALLKSAARDKPVDAKKLSLHLSSAEWTTPVAVPTLTQMLQAEATAVRLLLVDQLAKIEGSAASSALARRAVFDLSPEVRARAVRALATRPAAEYTTVLYEGFRYPLPMAADHAAEAVAELKRVEMVPALVKLLDQPSPTAPDLDRGGYTVQEVVRVNHLCNCVLCHAPSVEKGDPVRRSVPIPGQRIAVYYDSSGSSGSLAVRADITYLRQDFSVMQPVAKPDKWPAEQRYDYLVRTRPLSKAEQATFEKSEKEGKVPERYPQQAAVVYALPERTGQDHGTTSESWTAGLRKASGSPPARSNP